MDDMELRAAVIDALGFAPGVNPAHIGVIAEKGVVTLTGHVASYDEKFNAERAAQRVRGVHAIAQEIEVRYPSDKKASDDEIALRAIRVIMWQAVLPEDAIQVKVQDGFVTLTGTVDWHFQRVSAEAAVRKLSGVVGVVNAINLRPTSVARLLDVERHIRNALRHNADLEADAISVSVDNGNTVRLEGRVHALSERWIAEQAAWAVPGVTKVEDHLVVT